MANIKLTGHTWDASCIYDAEQEKTQKQVNSDLKTALYEIHNYKLANATFATSDGRQSSSTTRLCTNLIFLKKGAKVVFNRTNFDTIYGYYNCELTLFTSVVPSWYAASIEFTMPADGFFEIQFRKPNNATIEPEDFTDQLTIYNTFTESSEALIGVVINPDIYEGTDTEKLQSALTALASTGGCILICRKYVLEDNLVCTNDSNTNRLLRLIGIGNATIEFQNYSIKGGNVDHTGAHGGITLERITCLSSSATRAVMFDGDTLIRVYIKNCVISGFKNIVRSISTYVQTVFISDCVIRSTDVLVVADTGTHLYDVHISNNVIESCRNVFIVYSNNGIFVTNNLIEGLRGTPFSVRGDTHKVLINGNYFENNGSVSSLVENGSSLFALTGVGGKQVNVTVSDNMIHQSVNNNSEIDRLIVLPATAFVGQLIISGNFVLAGAMLVSCPTSRKDTNTLYYCNTTHETEYDQGQYDCGDYVTVITASMINNLFSS